MVARERKGKFPTTSAEWRELPGIGRYTAAAIASIAFGEPLAVVDGNVERVLQRFLGRPLSGEALWQAAEDVLDRERPGDFNQAMMELGATVCTPRGPACLTCPVVELCATRGEMAEAGKKQRQEKKDVDYALCVRDGGVLLVQRARDARLMAGMWELPEITSGAKAPSDKRAEIAALKRRATQNQVPRVGRNDKKSFGNEQDVLGNDKSQLLFTLRHSITVTDYGVQVWKTAAPSGIGEWVPVERLRKIALTGLARKILREAGLSGSNPRRSGVPRLG